MLDSIDNINEKINFLQSVVSGNKYVCYHGQCPIFSQILALRGLLVDLVIDSMDEIIMSDISETERSVLVRSYRRAAYECDKTLQEIMRVSTVNKALEDREETKQTRRIELIEAIAGSGQSIPVSVVSDIESVLDSREKKGDWNDAIDKRREENEGKKQAR